MASDTIVTRFAPSPTGYLHVGGARTALFSWLLARHAGGRFLLRIEDTDLARSTRQACEQLVEDLKWLGLSWDNADLMFQSKRTAIYNRIIDELIARGQAYLAYESLEELESQRRQAEKQKRAFIYKRQAYTPDQLRRFSDEGRTPVVRFAMPVKEYRFDDAVLGPGQGVGPEQVQDFVIRKSDGMPTYHFAVVVDDAEMGITHVLRGQEHLLNTVNHVALQEALGYSRPVYAHLPVILNPDTGEKLSKRDRDRKIRQRAHEWMKARKTTAADLARESGLAEQRVAEWLADSRKQLDLSEQPMVMRVIGLRESDLPEIMVHDFRKSGYLPEVLDNFLALLGWSPGGDRERMSMDDLVSLFSLDGVGKANARFNREKLLAFNTEAVAAAPPARLVRAFRDYLAANPQSPVNRATDEQLRRLLEMKKGFRILREVDELSRFLFVADDAIAYDPDAVEKVLKKNDSQGILVLRDLGPLLADIPDWTAPALDAAVKQYAEGKQLALGKVAQPLRVAVAGTSVSPPIFESLEFLTKPHTLARLDRCLANAG